ncbi:MAG: 4-(cytidine 5'-diphospho)-2-C-methyl-D-erythritol kinase [Actinomycetaceae bacterium]|nr:4-(cytidine 5'-diphospho)-2-C-methyl-D-erythritol kinase [Actinomycetaceae bacterium]
MQANAPGKLNITLAVGAPDERGYHPLHTIFQAVNVYETVSVRPASQWTVKTFAGETELQFVDPHEHLAVRAVHALFARFRLLGAASIHVHKRIPIAGGMAGGSADAAAALVATRATFGLPLGDNELLEVARSLGADVPFCLLGGTALGRRYGDKLESIPDTPTRHWVFARAHRGLSTPEVFRTFDHLVSQGRQAASLAVAAGVDTDMELAPLEPDVKRALYDTEPVSLGKIMFNDLQQAAFQLRPELAGTVQAALSEGALAAQVSGSGPTVVALAASAEEAQRIGRALQELPQVAGMLVTSGPGKGAEVGP